MSSSINKKALRVLRLSEMMKLLRKRRLKLKDIRTETAERMTESPERTEIGTKGKFTMGNRTREISI